MRLRFLRPAASSRDVLLLLLAPAALGPLAGAALGEGRLARRRVLVLLTDTAAAPRGPSSAVSWSGSAGVSLSSLLRHSASPRRRSGRDPADSTLEQGHPRQCRAAQRDRNPAQINTG